MSKKENPTPMEEQETSLEQEAAETAETQQEEVFTLTREQM